jgi:hypothetical protein
MINSTFDFCSFLNGTESNVLFKWILGMMRSTLPINAVHACPHIGVLAAFSLTIDQSTLLSPFSRGRYRAVTRVFDELDQNIVTTHIDLEKLYESSKDAELDV